jgi:predicted outer membrane repeat protein
MVEQCQTSCEDKGGAIFCDGQFVNAADVHDCADEVRLKIKIDIDIDAALDEAGEDVSNAASDVGKEVDKHVDVDTKCSVTNAGTGRSTGSARIGLPLVALAVWRVRRRRTSR